MSITKKKNRAAAVEAGVPDLKVLSIVKSIARLELQSGRLHQEIADCYQIAARAGYDGEIIRSMVSRRKAACALDTYGNLRRIS